MAIAEQVIVPAGYELVIGGLGARTVREVARPRGWLGLSIQDRELLRRFVARYRGEVTELHTDVPVGLVPCSDVCVGSCAPGEYGADVCALRIDACVLLGGEWRIVECKPDAGYVALGQLLVYRFYAGCAAGDLAGARCVVVTDCVQTAVLPVYEAFDIDVVEVGDEGG